MNRVLLLGAFGYLTDKLDGQTIKTRNILQLLRQHKELKVYYYDTLEVKQTKNPFLLVKLFWYFCICNSVIMVPADNSMEKLYPVVYKLSFLLRYKLLVICVGGWQVDFFEGTYKFSPHMKLLEISKKIHAFLPEMENVNKVLKEKYHFTNTEVFPNFRFVKPFEERVNTAKTLKLVYMARVDRNKGYDIIFEFARVAIREKLDVKIDFYGQIEKKDEAEFNEKIKLLSPNVTYKGFLTPDKIHTTLSGYDALLLPTKYYTEGFPGSILDAYIAGIPVIVSEWKHAHEFVKHDCSGLIVPFSDNQESFNTAVLALYNDREKLKRMKTAAKEEAKKYSPETAWNVISKRL